MKRIPKKYKGQGIHLYCNKCKRQISDICGLKAKNIAEIPLAKCEHQDSIKFKLIVHRSGINRKYTRISEANNIQEAVADLAEFKKELAASATISNQTDFTLSAGIKEYLMKLHREGSYKRKSKEVTPNHIKDCIRVLKRFVDCLKSHRIESDNLLMKNLKEEHTDLFLVELERDNCSESYNAKHIRIMRSFFSFLIKKQLYKGRNYFSEVEIQKIESSPVSLSDLEFEQILTNINFKNGEAVRGDGRSMNFYRPWLVSAFKVARYTGLRREELSSLKFSDIVFEEEEPVALTVRNFKVERLKGVNRILKAIPILPEMKSVLEEASSNQNIESDYIIGKEMNRKYLVDFLSRAFTHFFKVTFPDREPINFKSLRKAFITQVVSEFGTQAYTLTGHSGMKVINDHYYSQLEGAKKFSKLLNQQNKTSNYD